LTAHLKEKVNSKFNVVTHLPVFGLSYFSFEGLLHPQNHYAYSHIAQVLYVHFLGFVHSQLFTEKENLFRLDHGQTLTLVFIHLPFLETLKNYFNHRFDFVFSL
jgi:hypothetical protein